MRFASASSTWCTPWVCREEHSGKQVSLGRLDKAGVGVEEEVGVIGAPGPSARAAPNVLGELGKGA